MLRSVKRRLYFLVARYFRFWARLKLRRWNPKVIVVTGSAGKTTLLHLIEAQLGDEAHYSHHANSSFGIPYDILGLPGVRNSRLDWFILAVKTPFKSFSKSYAQRLYVAEVDTDRPGEGQFLTTLLKPAITLWVSSLHTHTAQFDSVVASGKFKSVEDAVAVDYGDIVAATKELVIINGDNELMLEQAKRSSAKVEQVHARDLQNYKLATNHTEFSFDGKTYTVPAPQPRNVYTQLAMVDKLLTHLQKQPDFSYNRFVMPPGRSSAFKGIKNTTLIDSTYNNSNVDSLRGVVEMFEEYPAQVKWLVLSDLIEQGTDDAREHTKIADVLRNTHFQKILLEGPRLKEHTLPKLSEELQQRSEILSFDKPTGVLVYLQEHIQGGETIAFKGVRFLEGVIEPLLANKEDAQKLVRREPMWQKWRTRWGL